ncbi:MAG: TIGR04222 domain-containing membrane protein [Pirellulaceae bacterium]
MNALQQNAQLWQKLQQFSIDPVGARFRFAAKLARENGWNRIYTARVIEEYRRFLFLAAIAQHPVSPSEQVDQAWHLHLTYTKSYWNDLCKNVLRRELHHEPSTGTDFDTEKMHDWYARTLVSYEKTFGAKPPEDIWPPRDRHLKEMHYRRINMNSNWVIPCPPIFRWVAQPKSSTPTLAAGILLMVPVVMATSPLNLRGPAFLNLYVGLLALGIVLGLLIRNVIRTRREDSSDQPLQPLEIACIGGGPRRVTQAALAGLLNRQILKSQTTNGKIKLVPVDDYAIHKVEGSTSLNPIEKKLLRAVKKEDGDIKATLRAPLPEAREIESDLQQRGYIETKASRFVAQWLPVAIMLSLLVLASMKIQVGLSREKPVAILVTFAVVTLFGMLAFMNPVYRTLRGQKAGKWLADHHSTKSGIRVNSTELTTEECITAVALFGMPNVHEPYLSDISTVLGWSETTSWQPWNVNSGSGTVSSSNSNCSGGGCGGGGCGGCGT